MLSPLDTYYAEQKEPVRSCLQFLRAHLLAADPNMTEAWKYSMPFFCYKGKMICYLWIHKKLLQPYIGIVDGKSIERPELIIEKRAKMKILLVDADKTIPVKKINAILKEMIALRTD